MRYLTWEGELSKLSAVARRLRGGPLDADDATNLGMAVDAIVSMIRAAPFVEVAGRRKTDPPDATFSGQRGANPLIAGPGTPP